MTEETPHFTTPQNTGVIPRETQPGDYIAEGDTGILYEENEPTGDFSPYAFADDGDYQHSVYFDGSTCTNYGWGHSTEMQLNRLLAKNAFSSEELKKLTQHRFVFNGKATRLSKRANAIKSGTNGGQIPGQFKGNYVYKPWDAARNWGAVPETLCPYPRLQRDPVFTMEQYFDPASITAEAEEVAKVWREVIETRYEIVSPAYASLEKHKKQAPLCIVAGVCKPWDGSIIPACDITHTHETVLYGSQTNVLFKDEDSYQPAHKRLAWGYSISFALKGVIYPKSKLVPIVTPPQFSYVWKKYMSYGETSLDIKKMQDFLKLKGFFPMNVASSGYYGNVTAGAVLKLQIKYSVAPISTLLTNKGRYAHRLTLAVLNSLAK